MKLMKAQCIPRFLGPEKIWKVDFDGNEAFDWAAPGHSSESLDGDFSVVMLMTVIV